MNRMDGIIQQIKTLSDKAESYDKLVLDLVTILTECGFVVTSRAKAPSTSEVVKEETQTDNDKECKAHALWRCRQCDAFNIRSSKRIKMLKGQWIFTEDVQSPCPSCNYRQRLQPKDVRIYVEKDFAVRDKNYFETHNITNWL